MEIERNLSLDDFERFDDYDMFFYEKLLPLSVRAKERITYSQIIITGSSV